MATMVGVMLNFDAKSNDSSSSLSLLSQISLFNTLSGRFFLRCDQEGDELGLGVGPRGYLGGDFASESLVFFLVDRLGDRRGVVMV